MVHGKKHSKKVQGRSGPSFGALWVRKLLKKKRGWKKIWKDACVEIGRACADPSFASSFTESCKVLAKIPQFGIKYGAKHMVRSSYVYRHWVWDLDDLQLKDNEWVACMQMNEDTTKKGFGALGVETMSEARVMKRTISEAMSAAASSTTPTSASSSFSMFSWAPSNRACIFTTPCRGGRCR